MFILHGTKLFTAGTLAGLTHDFTMQFATEQAAIDWAKTAEKGIKKPVGGSPYRVTEWTITSGTSWFDMTRIAERDNLGDIATLLLN